MRKSISEMMSLGYTEDERKRHDLQCDINEAIESYDIDRERARLLMQWPEAWDSDEFRVIFWVLGFAAPFVMVIRRSDGVFGWAMFQDEPRFYFGFEQGDRPKWSVRNGS